MDDRICTKTTTNKHFGGELKLLRIKLERLKMKKTLQQVGYQTGINQSDISRIESGRLIPYPSQLERLTTFFGMSKEELFQQVKPDEIAN